MKWSLLFRFRKKNRFIFFSEAQELSNQSKMSIYSILSDYLLHDVSWAVSPDSQALSQIDMQFLMRPNSWKCVAMPVLTKSLSPFFCRESFKFLFIPTELIVLLEIIKMLFLRCFLFFCFF